MVRENDEELLASCRQDQEREFRLLVHRACRWLRFRRPETRSEMRPDVQNLHRLLTADLHYIDVPSMSSWLVRFLHDDDSQ
jgi:hypothetical protein